MKNILTIIQIVCSVLLILAILLQTKGGGLSSVFNGRFRYHTKRGVEKLLFYFTIFLVAAFLGVSILAVALS